LKEETVSNTAARVLA